MRIGLFGGPLYAGALFDSALFNAWGNAWGGWTLTFLPSKGGGHSGGGSRRSRATMKDTTAWRPQEEDEAILHFVM